MGMVLAGGFLGFWVALLGYLGFGLSPLVALSIWAGAGPAGALVAVAAALLRRPEPAPVLRSAAA